MSEVSMWLYPVGIAAIVGFVVSARFGLRWTWGVCLQQVLILVLTILGFVFLYGMRSEELASYAAIAAWTLFVVFNVGQRILLNQLSLDLSLFRINEAQKRSRLVRLITWGPPGQYWCDMADALKLYNENRLEEADQIVRKWQSDPRMPAPAKESLVGFYMLGRVLLHDWQGIINEFENNQSTLSTSRTFVPYQMACRAFAELGRFAEAEECMQKANMQPAKTSATNLDINFMTLFALMGALEPLQKTLSRCRDFRALPEYVRAFWLGRCHAVRGESVAALESLKRCKQATPAHMETWHRRIDAHIAKQESIASGGTPTIPRAASPALMEKVEGLYTGLRRTVDVLRPSRNRPGTIWLMALLVVAYVVSNCDQFLMGIGDQSALQAFHKQCYTLGELSAPRLLKGDWWRTISYMFLHGNSAHLLMNTFALYLFGKAVENTYGTGRFLVIFFLSGILSGIMQIALVPYDSAIGASGAILGVFGAATAGIIKLKGVLPPQARRAELKWMISIAIAQVIFDQLVNGVAALTDKSPNGVRIASFAHLGGMLVGFVIGMLLPTRKFDRD